MSTMETGSSPGWSLPSSSAIEPSRRLAMDESVLRAQLVELLLGGQAHVKPESALADLGPQLRNRRPATDVHSVWEELEHLRIAQEDILRYTIDASWKSPKWP